MATKKQLPKKAAKAAKSAKPTRPTGGKAAAKKPAAKKAAKPAAKKIAPKKAAPAKKAVKAAAPKKVAKQAKPVSKPVSVAKKPSLPAKKSVPVKGKEIVQPVKKTAVAAPTHHEVKPAIKPLVKTVPKNEPPKKIVIPKTSTTKAVKYNPDFTKSVLDSPQQTQTGPSMRYSDAELAEFKDLILRKLETAKKELAYLQGLITRKDEGDMEDGRYMTMEDGSMSMEREQLSQMASRQITFIDHLEKAMMRIENKTYGICRVTGKLIDKARLRAVPHATLSIEAKQMMNK
ncbi:MAG TPA: TraR/DksA C4-type zinc finger protein [Flavisolibacter sp.]